MSISTVSQQFHVDIVDIDMVSKPGSMQNIVVDIDGFTAVSRRYHRYRQPFKGWLHDYYIFVDIDGFTTVSRRYRRYRHGFKARFM